jgi:hypothetical protein
MFAWRCTFWRQTSLLQIKRKTKKKTCLRSGNVRRTLKKKIPWGAKTK